MAKEERHKKRNNDEERRHIPKSQHSRRNSQQSRNQNVRDALLNYSQRALSLLVLLVLFCGPLLNAKGDAQLRFHVPFNSSKLEETVSVTQALAFLVLQHH
jgi:hypothetical protein